MGLIISKFLKRNQIFGANKSGSQLSDVEDVMDSDEGGAAYNSGVNRRKSVFAEAYDPEQEEDDETETKIYPKSDEQRQSLTEAVKDIFLFRSLDPEQLSQVLDAMFHRSVDVDECIIEQGDDGDNFYVIESGTYDIFVNGNKVGNYCDSGSFGELALMYNMPRAATIKATKSKGTLWALDRTTFRKIVLRAAFNKRKMYESLLERVPLLTSLSAYERMNLADALYTKTFKGDEVIVRQGDVADGMYFVESGKVVITMTQNGVLNEVTKISPGGYFGELALVTHKPRAATATALSPDLCKVAFLDVSAFERLLGPCMDVMRRNITDYQEQLASIFGSKVVIDDGGVSGK